MCFLQAKYMSCHGYVIFLFHLLQGICIIRVVLIYHLFTSYIVCSQENTCVDQLLGTSIFWHRMVFKLMSHCKTKNQEARLHVNLPCFLLEINY